MPNNTSYIYLLNQIEAFAAAHMQVKRFATDFPEQLPNFSTEDKNFPCLFVSPNNSIFDLNVNTFQVDVYCWDILLKDRSNTMQVISDTNLIINDLYRWFRDENITAIQIVDLPQGTPINNGTMDFTAGWKVTLTFIVDTYTACEIPFSNPPIIVVGPNDLIYTSYLTCATLADCPTFENAIQNLQNQIDQIQSEIPDQTGHAGEFLQTDGTNTLWAPVSGGTNDLATTLGFGNITGGHNIIMSNGDVISSPTPGGSSVQVTDTYFDISGGASAEIYGDSTILALAHLTGIGIFAPWTNYYGGLSMRVNQLIASQDQASVTMQLDDAFLDILVPNGEIYADSGEIVFVHSTRINVNAPTIQMFGDVIMDSSYCIRSYTLTQSKIDFRHGDQVLISTDDGNFTQGFLILNPTDASIGFGSTAQIGFGSNILGGVISLTANQYTFGTLTPNTVPYLDSTSSLVSSIITQIELSYLSGAASNIQNQINNINAGLAWKVAVRVATTANITLSGIQTIDGVAVIVGDRVLVKNQTLGQNNGIYVVASGAWTRSTDSDTGAKMLQATVGIEEGTVNADTIYTCTTDAPIIIGTTVLVFAKTSATTYTGSAGVSLVGNDFRLDNTYFTGEASLSAGVVTLLNSAVISKVLTGYISGAGTIAATDTILQAIQKLNGNISAIVSGVSSVFGRTGVVTAQSGDYNTSQVTENTNLYYTQARFDTAFAAKSTTNLAEGTNLYYTQARFDTAFAAKSTTNLAEGTNLYYTDARARLALSNTATGLTYTNTTGVTSLTSGYVIPTTTHDANLSKSSVSATFDGGGNVIVVGTTMTVVVPYSGTITGWQIFDTTDTPVASSVVVNVWKDTYANYPPDVTDAIFSTKPTLTTQINNQNLSPTFIGSGATVTAGDIIKFNIDSATLSLRCTVVLLITKS